MNDHSEKPPVNTSSAKQRSRKFFSISLRTSLILLTLLAPFSAWIYHRYFSDIYANLNYDTFQSVGAIYPDRANHVTVLLDSHRIPNIVEGSVIYGVSVPPEHVTTAIKILSADSKQQGYRFDQIFIDNRSQPKKTTSR
jgi:hypothetical protein